MPFYEFICDKCGFRAEVFRSMSEIVGLVVPCPVCAMADNEVGKVPEDFAMRRLFTNAGVVFKDGAPGQDIRREKEDSDIQRQRRKAWLLKDRGDVPDEHVIKLKEADDRFDKKYRDSDLDKQYDRAVKEGE